MQLADPVHRIRHRAGLVRDAAAADPRHGWPDDRRPALPWDRSSFAPWADRSAFPSAPGHRSMVRGPSGAACILRGIVLQCRFPDPGMQCLRTGHGDQFSLRRIARNICRTFWKPIAPLSDPVWMDIETLCQPDRRPRTLDRGGRHFGLEGRAVLPARPSRDGHPLMRGITLPLRGKPTGPGCSAFPKPPLQAMREVRCTTASAYDFRRPPQQSGQHRGFPRSGLTRIASVGSGDGQV